MAYILVLATKVLDPQLHAWPNPLRSRSLLDTLRRRLMKAEPTYFPVPGFASLMMPNNLAARLATDVAQIVAVEVHDVESAEDHGVGIAVHGFLHRDQLGLHRRNELEAAGARTYNFTHPVNTRYKGYISQSERNVIPRCRRNKLTYRAFGVVGRDSAPWARTTSNASD